MRSFVVFASAKDRWALNTPICSLPKLLEAHWLPLGLLLLVSRAAKHTYNAHTLTLSFLPSLILFLVSEVTLPPLVFWYIRVRWSFPLRTRARVAQQRLHYATGWKHQLWCRTDRFYYLFINFAATHLADEWRGGQQQVHHFLLT